VSNLEPQRDRLPRDRWSVEEAYLDVLLLDGECGLCHGLARWMAPRTTPGSSLRFVDQSSSEGQAALTGLPAPLRGMDTVVLVRGGKVHARSAAAIRCLLHLRWWWRMWFPLLWLVPKPLRDLVYRGVAANRHRLFRAPEDGCLLPQPN